MTQINPDSNSPAMFTERNFADLNTVTNEVTDESTHKAAFVAMPFFSPEEGHTSPSLEKWSFSRT